MLGAGVTTLTFLLFISGQLLSFFTQTPRIMLFSTKGLGAAGLLSLPLVTPSAATLLYVASYAGTVTTLNLTLSSGANYSASLEAISTSTGCASSPSWLTLDTPNSVLYCTDEGLSTPLGSLSSFQTNDDGTLVQLDQISVISGPVSAVIYGEDGDGLALAHYSGSGFSTFSIADPAALAPVQNETFTLAEPGPNPDRQDAPHPHEAILDPTGEYIIVPDLGADLVRIFQVDEDGLTWTAVDPLVAAPGSGPRHATFLVTDDATYMYLVAELANTITGYKVEYESELAFTELFAINTHGEGSSVPNGTTAAEIALSPDENFIIVSSRGENSFNIINFDPSNSTEIVSDAILTFSVDHSCGNLSFVQEFPAGGRVPRQFSINKAGDLLAVGLQSDGRVVLIDRDVKSGQLKRFAANALVEGEVTAVIFDE
ncbi:hypothetical protein LQW54_006226 [Pestalotiopsis sp. IQ-011]